MTSSAAGAPIGQGTQGAPFISSVPVMRGQAPQLNRTIAVDRNQTMAEVAPPPWNPNGSSLKGGSPTTWNGQIANTGIALSASSCSTHRTRPVEENARDACSDISSMTFSPEFSNESERLAELNRLGEKPLALDAAQRALRILRWRQKRRMQVEAFRRERERNPDRRRAVAKRRPRIGGRFLPKALELSVLERRTQAQKEAEERHA
ncbi:hypothetical protein F1559_004651 [Cyanidiococcus yangmingshanensis]|uniref:CCT domain-containing protein n=1 Tax=Cyanidiococcus yangmingshanensis TaxID=2690220 RepID=A0A7J7IN95_9RHOD|nr:hypothetical protein F1559_004651 [Cyanidiococcus yangmingshanensis]